MIKISVGIAYEQNQPTGVASALRAQFGFFGEKCLKSALYKIFLPDKSCYPLLLCDVTFFNILHHYGVITASQICSVSRKYCAVLRNRFFFFNCKLCWIY